jgi:hypothetical protein
VRAGRGTGMWLQPQLTPAHRDGTLACDLHGTEGTRHGTVAEGVLEEIRGSADRNQVLVESRLLHSL